MQTANPYAEKLTALGDKLNETRHADAFAGSTLCKIEAESDEDSFPYLATTVPVANPVFEVKKKSKPSVVKKSKPPAPAGTRHPR